MAGDGKTPGTGEQVVVSQGERVENVCESVNATTFQRGGEGREREMRHRASPRHYRRHHRSRVEWSV